MSKKSLWILIPLVIIAIFIALVIIGTLTKEKSPSRVGNNQQQISGDLTKGVSLSPISFSGNDFTNFFTKAKEVGGLISWAGNWEELKNKNSAPYVLSSLSEQYKFKPVIITSIPDSYSEDYKSTIVNFVKENKPEYLAVGNEINNNYKESYPMTFSKIYEEIKKVSPETKVFTIFQLEKMKQSDNWDILDDFPQANLIAFTTYPEIIYQETSQIPDNYYSEIQTHTGKKIAFTEVGWSRKENQQVEFIQKFSEKVSPTNPEFRIWPFLYDQNIQAPFNIMGLLEKNQETSPAFEAWKRI
ncbi:Uncharacterised protein [uncultured archaeon]|nr:Uncharacterised protein [uncultured archaeon]